MVGMFLALALASTYPQVQAPSGVMVAPQPVAGTGIDSVTGKPCALASASTCQETVADPYDAPYATSTAMSAGTTYPAGRAVEIVCSVAGSVTLNLASGGTVTWPAGVGGTILSFAVTSIPTPPSGCAVSNLN